MRIACIAAIVLLLNMPFGYWRASAKKFSPQWIFAIHLPVPLIVALRIYGGLGWQLAAFPVMIGSFFLGQFIGGRLRIAK